MHHNISNYLFITARISILILHSVLYTFPKDLARRIFNQSRASLVDDHSFILVSLMCDLGVICQSVLDKIVHPRVFIVYLPYERNLCL